MAVNLALAMGGSVGDIDDVSRSLKPLAKVGDHSAAEEFYAAWTGLGSKLKRLAADDEARGRLFSAGAKIRRAFIYFIQAERMQRPDFFAAQGSLSRGADCFSRFLRHTAQNCRRVEVPYGDTALPALLIRPRGAGRQPVHGALRRARCHQGDHLSAWYSRRTRRTRHRNARSRQSRRRQIAAFEKLAQFSGSRAPGQGCRRLSPVDAGNKWQSHRDDGAIARRLSCAASAAFEPRFKCCVAWGANYDWGETQRRRYEAKEQRLPVPHYWDHVAWVFGKSSVEDVMRFRQSCRSKASCIGSSVRSWWSMARTTAKSH